MQSRYSLRTLYRDASKVERVRMSGATAEKIRIAEQEPVFEGGNCGTGSGLRVGREIAPTLAPQADAPQQLISNVGPSTSTPLQDPIAELRELCRKERERGVSLTVEKTVENPILLSRSLVADPVGGSPKSPTNWVKPPVSMIAKRRPPHGNATQGLGMTDNPTLAVAAFAPALRTPGLSPSTKAGEDQFSSAPTVATPLLPALAKPGRFLDRRLSRSLRIPHNSI